MAAEQQLAQMQRAFSEMQERTARLEKTAEDEREGHEVALQLSNETSQLLLQAEQEKRSLQEQVKSLAGNAVQSDRPSDQLPPTQAQHSNVGQNQVSEASLATL